MRRLGLWAFIWVIIFFEFFRKFLFCLMCVFFCSAAPFSALASVEELARGASIARDGLLIPHPRCPTPGVSGFVPPSEVGACKHLASSLVCGLYISISFS